MADYINQKLSWQLSKIGFNPSGHTARDPDDEIAERFANDISKDMEKHPWIAAIVLLLLLLLIGVVAYNKVF